MHLLIKIELTEQTLNACVIPRDSAKLNCLARYCNTCVKMLVHKCCITSTLTCCVTYTHSSFPTKMYTKCNTGDFWQWNKERIFTHKSKTHSNTAVSCSCSWNGVIILIHYHILPSHGFCKEINNTSYGIFISPCKGEVNMTGCIVSYISMQEWNMKEKYKETQEPADKISRKCSYNSTMHGNKCTILFEMFKKLRVLNIAIWAVCVVTLWTIHVTIHKLYGTIMN